MKSQLVKLEIAAAMLEVKKRALEFWIIALETALREAKRIEDKNAK